MSEQIEYTLPVDLGDGKPLRIGSMSPVPGPAEVEIVSSKLVTDGKTTLRFQVAFLEGDAAGLKTGIVVGTDMEAGKGFNRKHLSALYRGLHDANGKAALPADKIKGQITVTPAHFAGQRAYVFVADKAEGEKYADINFITPEEYAALKTSGGLPKQAAKTTATTQAATPIMPPPPVANGAAAPSLTDLFK